MIEALRYVAIEINGQSAVLDKELNLIAPWGTQSSLAIAAADMCNHLCGQNSLLWLNRKAWENEFLDKETKK